MTDQPIDDSEERRPDFDGQWNEAKETEELKRKLLLAKRRKLYLTDYYEFVTDCLGNRVEDIAYVNDPGVVQATRELGGYLLEWQRTKHEQSDFMKVMYIMPREGMKSTFVTEGLPIWAHCHDPNIAMAISSAREKNMTEKFVSAIQAHWEGKNESSNLVKTFGEYRFEGSKRKWRQDQMVTDARVELKRHDPSMTTFTVKTGGTSGHYDVVILDDPITEEQVQEFGETWYEKTWTHYKSLGYVVRKDGIFVLVCTRYGARDLVGQIIEKEIEPVVRKRVQIGAPEGILPDDFKLNWHQYAWMAGWKVIFRMAEYDHETNEKRIMFPIVWPQERIDARRATDPLFVATQLNNMPSSREDNPVKPIHIQRMWVEPEEVPNEAYGFLTLHADWAWKDGVVYRKNRGDYNVLFAVAHWKGHAYPVKGWFSDKAKQAECGEKFVEFMQWAKMPKFYGDVGGRFRIFTYDKPIGGMGEIVKNYFVGLASERGLTCPNVKEMIRSNKKADRLLSVAGYWTEPRMHLVKGVMGLKEAAEQMLMIDDSRHDDHADTLVDAFDKDVVSRVPKSEFGATGNNFGKPALRGLDFKSKRPSTGQIALRERL